MAEELQTQQIDSPTTATVEPAVSTPDTTTTQPQDNIRQLREAYEGVKRDFEPWQKLGVKPDDVGRYSTVYQKTYEAAAELGKSLGYPDDEIVEALQADPVRCLDFLREQAAQNAPPEQELSVDELVEQRLSERLAPWEQERNVQATDAANTLFEQTVYKLASDLFKKEGIDYATVSDDEKNFIMQGVSEVLKYDEAALRDLKYGRKTAGVQKAFHDFFSLADKYYLARNGRGKAKLQPGMQGAPAAAPEGKKPSLDDYIANPGLLGDKYK